MSRFACLGLSGGKVVAALFLAALLARGALIIGLHTPFTNPDSSDYISLAGNLLSSGSYSIDGKLPDCTRPPGYPFFVAAVNYAGGKISLKRTAAAQAAVDSSSAVLVYLLALEFISPPFALAAGMAYALHPVFACFSRLMLSESLFMFFWLFFLLAARKTMTSGSIAFAAASGAVLSMALLVRPTHILYPVAFAPVLYFGVRDLKKSLLILIALAAAAQLGIAPWKARNKTLFGISTVTTGAGVAFWAGSLPEYPTRADLSPVWPRGDFKSPEADRAFMLKAKENWAARKWTLIGKLPRRLLRFWVTSHSSVLNFPQQEQGSLAFKAAKAAMFAVQLLTLLLAAAGAWLLRRRWRDLLFLLMPAVYVSGHILNDWGPARYHISALPCLLIAGCWAAQELAQRRSKASSSGPAEA
ncbi:MAG: glycosyltransferase family 39 protein [Elusimicrobia bacterium]|nr:glycosyltransferase family 39 protein [Elusimicrobiota bacterium]